MKKVIFCIILGAFLVGCSSPQASNKNQTTKTTKPTIQMNTVHVIKNDGNELDLTVTAENNTNKAIFIHLSDFVLSNNSTTLSPSSNSKVPSQIPANSMTNITLDFNVKGQLSGTINPKLGFQPSDNQPELFQSFGSIKIPVFKPEGTSKSVSSTQSTTSKPNTNNVNVNSSSSASHNYQADIEQDVAVITSKAAKSQWEPLVHPNPDAEVPDGFGGMLYAWNVILNGNGDGSAEQIFFFDNNRYIGTDTSQSHLPSSIHAGSIGTIIATYEHYLTNDAMCCPSGQPFTVSFHWNGSSLNPDSVAALNNAVNDQFK